MCNMNFIPKNFRIWCFLCNSVKFKLFNKLSEFFSIQDISGCIPKQQSLIHARKLSYPVIIVYFLIKDISYFHDFLLSAIFLLCKILLTD